MDHTKVSLELVKRQKKDTNYKTIENDCAYACALHNVQSKQTHCQNIARAINVRLRDCYKCMYCD